MRGIIVLAIIVVFVLVGVAYESVIEDMLKDFIPGLTPAALVYEKDNECGKTVLMSNVSAGAGGSELPVLELGNMQPLIEVEDGAPGDVVDITLILPPFFPQENAQGVFLVEEGTGLMRVGISWTGPIRLDPLSFQNNDVEIIEVRENTIRLSYRVDGMRNPFTMVGKGTVLGLGEYNIKVLTDEKHIRKIYSLRGLTFGSDCDQGIEKGD